LNFWLKEQLSYWTIALSEMSYLMFLYHDNVAKYRKQYEKQVKIFFATRHHVERFKYQ